MSNAPSGPFKVAAVQASPVFLDRDATVAKACRLIVEAGQLGARLAVFPETFIPAYPDWVWYVPVSERPMLNDLYGELLDQSVTVPGDVTRALGEAARQARVHVVMGVNERNAESSGASLYNSLVYIDDQGELVGRRRKLVPTGPERMVWAQGDGSTFNTWESPLGRIGALICWENYMPLARFAMYAWGTQLYLAPTWDRGEPWLSTLRHIAKEGRVHVVGVCQALRVSDIPDRFAFKRFYPADREWANTGDSAVVNPDGQFIAGPVSKKEEIVIAEVAPAKQRGVKWSLDVAGHYGRPDVFQLTVNRELRPMIRVVEDGGSAGVAPSARPPRARSAGAKRAPRRSVPRKAARRR
jgi:nitrilase